MHKSLVLIFIVLSLFPMVMFAQSFSDREVVIKTDDERVTLAGTLVIPKGHGKFPAMLLIQGNGPHTRDDSVSGSPLFRQIAEYFAGKGMVVLRVDKRGFGKSTGEVDKSEGNYTTMDLVHDFNSAYHFLNTQSFVDTSNVGIVGHSEGGLIASILASQTLGLDWAVAIGAPAVSGDSIVYEQTRLNRKQLGFPDETSRQIGEVWKEYFQFIKSGYIDDSEFYEIGKRFLMAHGLEEDDKRITHKFIDQLLDEYMSPWYHWFFLHDPAAFISKIDIPFLGIFGDHDNQVTANQNLLPMLNALKSSGNKHFQIKVLSDEDHFFVKYNGQRMEKHEHGKMEISKTLLMEIEYWLAQLK